MAFINIVELDRQFAEALAKIDESERSSFQTQYDQSPPPMKKKVLKQVQDKAGIVAKEEASPKSMAEMLAGVKTKKVKKAADPTFELLVDEKPVYKMNGDVPVFEPSTGYDRPLMKTIAQANEIERKFLVYKQKNPGEFEDESESFQVTGTGDCEAKLRDCYSFKEKILLKDPIMYYGIKYADYNVWSEANESFVTNAIKKTKSAEKEYLQKLLGLYEMQKRDEKLKNMEGDFAGARQQLKQLFQKYDTGAPIMNESYMYKDIQVPWLNSGKPLNDDQARILAQYLFKSRTFYDQIRKGSKEKFQKISLADLYNIAPNDQREYMALLSILPKNLKMMIMVRRMNGEKLEMLHFQSNM